MVSVLDVGPCSKLVTIQAFNGSVYATFFMLRYEIQVWRMRSYGGKVSWTREFVMDDIPKDWMEYPSISLVKAFEDGQIFCLVKGDILLLYDPKTRRKKIEMFNGNERADSCVAIQSLNFGSLPDILSGMMKLSFILFKMRRLFFFFFLISLS